jgi:hypothetical protein
MESRMGGMSAKCKESKEKNPRESQYVRKLTVAVAVQRTLLNKRLECPSCMRTKVKTAVLSSPARNWATPRLDETDLYSQARDDAKRITATYIMVKISKLHAGTRYGNKNRGYYYKMWSKHGNKERGPCPWTFRRDFVSTQKFECLESSRVSRVPGQPRLSQSGEVHGQIPVGSAFGWTGCLISLRSLLSTVIHDKACNIIKVGIMSCTLQ